MKLFDCQESLNDYSINPLVNKQKTVNYVGRFEQKFLKICCRKVNLLHPK